MSTPRPPDILFTAFEPSGDDHAAAVIEKLREYAPELSIAAWGGANMRAAGADIIEHTGSDPVMGIPGPDKIAEHLAINRRIDRWLRDHPVRVHVPVDSPAANFPICKIAKKHGAKVVHLVAPQVWAWGSWRVNKLRRATDLVLCLLPFEETYFSERNVPARFIGHPLFDDYEGPGRPFGEAKMRRIDAEAQGLIEGSPKLALLPGSRKKEHLANFPLLLETYRVLKKKHATLAGVVAASSEEAETRLRQIAQESGGWPEDLDLVVHGTDAVVRWCDVALVVSGTVTLQVARQQRPMVAVYKSSKLMYQLIGRWLLSTRYFTLPNLIADREVVPEFVPHFDGHERITAEVERLLLDLDAAANQRDELVKIIDRFHGEHAADNAAHAIARMVQS